MRHFELIKTKEMKEISISHRKIIISKKEYEKILIYDENKILIYNSLYNRYNIIEIEKANEIVIYKKQKVIEIYGKILNV